MIKKNLPHLFAAIAFLITAVFLCPDVLTGKIANQPDMQRSVGAYENIQDYNKKNESSSLWNASLFGGMPSFFAGAEYPNNLLSHVHNKVFTLSMPRPIGLFFIGFICAYVLFIALGMRPWLSVIGAIATVLASYNFIIFEVGHITKLRTIVYFPLITAGIVYVFKDKYLLGGSIFGLGLGLALWSDHVQMVYYLAICLFIFVACYLFFVIKNKELKTIIKPAIFLAIFAILAIGANSSKLWCSYEYMQHTMRGPSVLEKQDGSVNNSNGLDKDYVFNWSHGKAEIFTYLIPGFLGGSSSEPIGSNSAFAEDLLARGASESDVQKAPLYYGNMPFTAGPTYYGAIIIFLFVLGLFLTKGYIKWWVIATTILFTLLSFGKNLAWFNDLFYNYFPLYNKFRSVNSCLVVLQLTFPVLAVLGLNKILNSEVDLKIKNKKLLLSFYITGGICLFFATIGPFLIDFGSAGDEQLTKYGYNLGAILEDRASLLRSDSFRSLLFIGLSVALIWTKINDKLKIKDSIFYLAIVALVFLDLSVVGKRYLNSDKFVDKEEYNAKLRTPRAVDVAILNDTDPNYRVFDLSIDAFNSNTATMFHSTIGGYHAAKLRRYQDIIDRHISKNNMSVLNMLNTKYFIQKDESGKEQYQMNPQALGNCWFVDSIELVNNANEEIDALTSFDPSKKAIVHKEFSDIVQNINTTNDSTSRIVLKEYEINKLVYTSNTNENKLAVFSEVWYASGKKGWQTYIDGQPVDHIRANYILRALKIPKGEHEIIFEFKPDYYYKGETISLGASALLILSFVGSVVFYLRRK